jgi:Uma2 family endonuclease
LGAAITKVTEEEYLRLERAAEYKSEFIDGEIFARSSCSPKHVLLATNWGAELVIQLRGRRCGVFNSDLRIRTARTGSYVYPDVSVVCGKLAMHAATDDVITNPILVVEILSPSTSNYDRGKKFQLYREIPSLHEYVLVHQDKVQVEHFSRQSDGSWIFREHVGNESTLVLSSINYTIKLKDVYSDPCE